MAIDDSLNEITVLLSRLQTNYSNLMTSWYDMFYNTTPMTVSIQLYNDAGVLTTYNIPNRAKDFTYVQTGNGSPEGNVTASMGTIYQDLTNGALYIKKTATGSTGWVILAIKNDISAVIMQGDGSPEGNLVAIGGTLYVDLVANSLYIKTTSTGNTGWKQIYVLTDVITVNGVQEITNKIINAQLNTITNIGLSNFSNGLVSTVVNSNSTNNTLPTSKAVETALIPKLEASNITAGRNVSLTKDGNNIEISSNTFITPFCANSGTTSTNLITMDSHQLSFMVGTNSPYAPLTATNAQNSTFTKYILPSVSLTNKVSGNYAVLLSESNNAYVLNNNVVYQQGRPTDSQVQNFTSTNITPVNGIATGASGAYITTQGIPFNNADTWHFDIDYTPLGGGSFPTIIGAYSTSSACSIHLYTENNILRISLSSIGTSYNIINAASTGYTLTPNVEYNLRVGYDGTQYYVAYAGTGGIYHNIWTLVSSALIKSNPVLLFNYAGQTAFYNTGSINLYNTKVYINDQLYWEPYHYENLIWYNTLEPNDAYICNDMIWSEFTDVPIGSCALGGSTYTNTSAVSNLTPYMYSNKQYNFIVSDSNNNTEAYKLQNGTTSYDTANWTAGGYWYQIKYPQNFIITKYTVQASQLIQAAYPFGWTVQGSNDGTTWTTVDTQASQAFTLGQVRTYTFTNTTGYLYYRWTATAGLNASSTSKGALSSLNFYGVPSGSYTSFGVPQTVTSNPYNQNNYRVNYYSPK